MAMWQHKFGVYVWRSVWRCTRNCVSWTAQLTFPHRMSHIHTKRMLPRCHNGPYTFLVILN
jgi:hypothetical protein